MYDDSKLPLFRALLFVFIFLNIGCATGRPTEVSKLPTTFLNCSGQLDRVEFFRMRPDQDVRAELAKWVVDHGIKAASILSAVGSVKNVNLRFAGEEKATLLTGPFEVVALSGTLAGTGVHLHMAVSDKFGKTSGGHLSDGSKVNTTLELVIAVYRGVEMLRQMDFGTGYNELFLVSQGCR